MYQIVVVDSRLARIFRTPGPGRKFEAVRELANPGASRHERDLVTSRPGRVFNRVAGVRQALAVQSERRRQTQNWWRSVGRSLSGPLAAPDADGLLLVAGPRAAESILAVMRPGPDRDRLLVHRRNLADQSVAELQRRLQAALQSMARQRTSAALAGSARRGRSSAPGRIRSST